MVLLNKTTLSLILIIGLSSFSCFSEDKEQPMKDPLVDIKISRGELEGSLMKMKNEGKISEKEYNESLVGLKNMNDEALNSLTETSKDLVRKNPDKADNLWKDKQTDLSKVQAMVDE